MSQITLQMHCRLVVAPAMVNMRAGLPPFDPPLGAATRAAGIQVPVQNGAHLPLNMVWLLS